MRGIKLKHILINILPLFVWVIYYCATMTQNEFFIDSLDAWVALAIFVGFTIYNLISKAIKEFVVRNLVLTTSWACGIYIGGQIYLKVCSHTSDEHSAVGTITIEHIIYGIVITGVACLIMLIIDKARKQKR